MGPMYLHMLLKPMIFDGIVFEARCHTPGFKSSKGECTNIVLMNIDMQISIQIEFKPNICKKLLDHVGHRAKFFAGGAEGNIASIVERAISV
jgi:hypothetical protein